MIARQELVTFLDDRLTPNLFKDYGPNGLQVQGKESIQTVITGVTANTALIEQAKLRNADALLVHHGIFWQGKPKPLVKVHYEHVKGLMSSDMNLLAYHLPLDAHPQWGNNAQLAARLELEVEQFVDLDHQPGLCAITRPRGDLTIDLLTQRITTTLNREPLVVGGGAPKLKRIAICTGGAQGYLPQMIELGVDAYLTGEYSLPMVELAQESGIHFIAAGHHATERYGVQALGKVLQEELNLDVQFIDIPNPA